MSALAINGLPVPKGCLVMFSISRPPGAGTWDVAKRAKVLENFITGTIAVRRYLEGCDVAKLHIKNRYFVITCDSERMANSVIAHVRSICRNHEIHLNLWTKFELIGGMYNGPRT